MDNKGERVDICHKQLVRKERRTWDDTVSNLREQLPFMKILQRSLGRNFFSLKENTPTTVQLKLRADREKMEEEILPAWELVLQTRERGTMMWESKRESLRMPSMP